jgi:hypothetical protein
MTPIDMGRVVLGGVVAAVVVNVGEGIFGYVMRDEYAAALRALGVRLDAGPALFLPLAWSVAVGVISVWLYAAIRPRYGGGPRTAVRAGLAVWALGTATFAISMASLRLFPARLMAAAAAWSLAEVVVAMLVAAWLYRERSSPALS